MPAPWESEQLDQLFFYSRVRVRQWRGGEILALVVEGHLDAEGAAGEFASLLMQAAIEPVRGVILDLQEVTFLPSKVLPALVSLRTTLTQRGGMLAIVSPTERLGRLLGLLGMEKAILIGPDAEAVYASVRGCLEGGPASK